MKNDPNTNSQINLYKEKNTMNNTINTTTTNNTLNTLTSNKDTSMKQNNMNPNTHVIALDNLMELITDDYNFVAAARKVKSNAFNSCGSEYGIVKKACDMILDNPSFRENIRQNLLKGTYYPEGIVFDPLFEEKNMVLPRGFKYTMNQIMQTMIMNAVEDFGVFVYTMPHAWSETHNPGVSKMIAAIDRIRAKGYKCWFVLNLTSFLVKIPHDRLEQKMQIVFQDTRVVDVICTLMGLHVPEADEDNTSEYLGIPTNTPLTDLLAYEIYLAELDQEIARLGLDFVRFNEKYVVFCDSYEHAKHAQSMLWAFTKDTMKCPANRIYSKIKDIAHLAFYGLRLWRGKWRIQEQLKKNAEDGYTAGIAKYLLSVHASCHATGTAKSDDENESILWSAYRKLSRFISFFEGIDDVKDEVFSMKEQCDKDFMTMLKASELYKYAIATNKAKANTNVEQPGA